jgi:hypothetical protein
MLQVHGLYTEEVQRFKYRTPLTVRLVPALECIATPDPPRGAA